MPWQCFCAAGFVPELYLENFQASDLWTAKWVSPKTRYSYTVLLGCRTSRSASPKFSDRGLAGGLSPFLDKHFIDTVMRGWHSLLPECSHLDSVGS